MAKMLDAVQRFRKIEEATAARDDPAPVYLLDEIADMARQSPEGAQAIADAVEKKLGAKSPVTKFKALRIIKHLCVKGCSTFQRCMQRYSSSVRELIHFKGDPDPFKGDVPNARVREFAKEVVEVLFNSAPVAPQSNSLAAQGKIQGFGSGTGPEARSGGPYSGIGSSGSSSMGRAGGGSGSGGSSSLSAYVPSSINQLSTQLGAQLAAGDGLIAQGLASAASAVNDLLGRSQYGGRLTDGRDSPTREYNSMASYAAPVTTQGVSNSQVLGNEDSAVSDICTPAGLRPAPDAADLRHFVDVISGMDGLRVAELLRAKMGAPNSWQVQLRALSALEAVLQRGSSQACGEVAVMFQSDATPVREALQHAQHAVRAVAARVIKLLLGEEVAVAPAAGGAGGKVTPTAAAAAAAAAPMVDLLSMDDEPGTAAAAAAPAAATGLDLLAGLDVPAAAPAAPAAAAAAAAVGSPSGDLFGGLLVAAPAAPAAPPMPAAAPLDDLLGSLTLSAPVATSNGTARLSAPVPAAANGMGGANLLGSPTFAMSPMGAGLALGGAPAAMGGMPGVPGAVPLQMQSSWPQMQGAVPAGAAASQGMPGSMLGQPLQPGSLMMGGMGMGMGGAAGPAGGVGMPMSHPQLLQQKLGGSGGGGVSGAIGRSSSSGAQAAGGPGLQAWTAKEIGIVDKQDPAFDWMKGEFGKK